LKAEEKFINFMSTANNIRPGHISKCFNNVFNSLFSIGFRIYEGWNQSGIFKKIYLTDTKLLKQVAELVFDSEFSINTFERILICECFKFNFDSGCQSLESIEISKSVKQICDFVVIIFHRLFYMPIFIWLKVDRNINSISIIFIVWFSVVTSYRSYILFNQKISKKTV
jgi:hypothetical protein